MAPTRIALGLLLALFIMPLLNLVLAVSPAQTAAALAAPQTLAALRVSLAASLVATAVATLLGVPAAYALARSRPAVRAAGLLALALPVALPPVASGIVILGFFGGRAPLGGWLAAHGAGVVDSFAGVAVSEFFVAGPLVAIAATAAFAELDPALEEAARTLGATQLRSLLTIALPLAASGIGAGILLSWLRALGEYGATSLVAYHPTSLPVELYVALSADGLSRAMALTEAFFVLSALGVAVAWIARRRLA